MIGFHRRKYWRETLAVLAAGLAGLPARAQTLGLAPAHDISPWRVVGALLFCCVLGAAGALALRYRLRGTASRPRAAARGRGLAAVDWRQAMAGFALKTRTATKEVGRLQVVETVRLGYQVEVNLLECDGKSLVIVTSPQGAFVANPDAPGGTGAPS